MKYTTALQMNMMDLMCGMGMCGMVFGVEKFRLQSVLCGLCKN